MCNGTDRSPPRLITGGAIAILHPPRPSSSSSFSSSSSSSPTSSISSPSPTFPNRSDSPSTHPVPYALHLRNPTAQGYTQATLSTIDVTGHPLATLGLRRGSSETHRELEGLKRCRLVIQYVSFILSCIPILPTCLATFLVSQKHNTMDIRSSVACLHTDKPPVPIDIQETLPPPPPLPCTQPPPLSTQSVSPQAPYHPHHNSVPRPSGSS